MQTRKQLQLLAFKTTKKDFNYFIYKNYIFSIQYLEKIRFISLNSFNLLYYSKTTNYF